MKVFWSWQSDHPGRISRHFVREALELAVEQLNESPEIQEAEREVTLDHDRKGVPGSPDLANTILAKIRASDVFVADVSPVGKTDATPPKRLINSNVAIELGYALDALGDSRLIMVMNEHYGSRDDLPFDLRHKAGPVMYSLAPDSGAEEISRTMRRFAGVMKLALKDMVPLAVASTPAFVPTPSIVGDPSRYFDPTKPLVSRGSPFARGRQQEFRVPRTPLLYLRISPLKALPPLKRADAVDLIRQEPLRLDPLYYRPTGASFEANEYGALVFDANYDQGTILLGAQLFLNREIWGFNATLLDPDERKGIPTLAVERTLAAKLPQYLEFARSKLGVAAPVRIEGGASGIRGYAIYMPSNYIEREWGPIQDDRISWSGTLVSFDPAEVDAALLNIFDAFFDAGGVRRPTGLYKFPGSVAGTMPQG